MKSDAVTYTLLSMNPSNHMNFALLDPRNTPQALAHNDAIFAARDYPPDPAALVYGIEVTIPELAARCRGNLDPQHTEKRDVSAISAACDLDESTMRMIDERYTLVTVRADLDSVGAMAIIEWRKGIALDVTCGSYQHLDGCEPYGFRPGPEMDDRIAAIDKLDRFAFGDWVPSALPSSETRVSPLAAVALMCMDHAAPLADRVKMMLAWLRYGDLPLPYIEQAVSEHAQIVDALASGQISITPVQSSRCVIVESTHKDALKLGYCVAPVVIAINPEFRFSGGEPHRKITITKFNADQRADLVTLAKRLGDGWGGTSTIIGSPQGVNCETTTSEIVYHLSRGNAFR